MRRSAALFATCVLAATAAHAEVSVTPPLNAPAARFDPYKNFKFRVVWDGHIISGVTRVGPLVRTTQTVSFTPGGGGPTIATPGRTTYEAVTLEREVTHDPAFEAWADRVYTPAAPAGQPQSMRKDVEISILDQSGQQLLFVYRLTGCWPTEYMAISDIEANPPAAPLQRLTLTCNAWDRDRTAGSGP